MQIGLIWMGLLALLFGGAAAMELGAIRNRVNGANGLVIFVAGVLGVFSTPIGFALLWWTGGAANAGLITASVAVVSGLLWWGLVLLLDRTARAHRSQ